jgi:tRNA nucleotidyltransferase/poly(A) polymerase
MSSRLAAIKVVRSLREHGHEALFAGGCVRDMLLGRPAKDYDVTTSAHPEEVMKLFRRTLKVGAKFGVVIVLEGDWQMEVATFRTESGYVDGRHPSVVEFTGAREDAKRRDFTINGMFYDPIEEKVIDYVGGQKDLRARVLRTIGSASERFGEDYLRMLRAVRFAAQLGFTIETKTWAAVTRHAKEIAKISAERIAVELEAMITSPNRAKGAMMLVESSLAAAVFPGFVGNVADAGAERLGLLRKEVSFALALATLLSEYQTPEAIGQCQRLKLSGDQNKHIKWLLERRGRLLEADMSIAHLKTLAVSPYFSDLLELQRAIQIYHGLPTSALAKARRRLNELKGQELQPKPLLDGHELVRLGATPGPQVGHLAREMYFAQLEGRFADAEGAGVWVAKWLKEHRPED